MATQRKIAANGDVSKDSIREFRCWRFIVNKFPPKYWPFVAEDKQKQLLQENSGHFSMIKMLHLADLITELNGIVFSLGECKQ